VFVLFSCRLLKFSDAIVRGFYLLLLFTCSNTALIVFSK
jgi:hypothetical protein